MKLKTIFNVEICKNPISMEVAYENPWKTPYVTTTSFNNWVETFVDYPAQYEWWKITVSKDWWSADAFLQEYPFCWNEKVMVLSPKIKMNKKELLFYCYLINKNKYKFAYWRKCSVERINELDLIDIKDFPKWVYNVNINKLTTKNLSWMNKFNVENRGYFYLKNICKIFMWNKLDYSFMTKDEPKINFVWRSAENNWVVEKVDLIEWVKPYKAWCISVALWWSLWSSYIQNEDFYTSQNVAVLEFDKSISIYAKLFITTCIINESKYKYFPFWRELNTHIRKDFWFTLPILRDNNWEPIIDSNKKYNEEWYIPDREFMENYIKNLPYWDRI